MGGQAQNSRLNLKKWDNIPQITIGMAKNKSCWLPLIICSFGTAERAKFIGMLRTCKSESWIGCLLRKSHSLDPKIKSEVGTGWGWEHILQYEDDSLIFLKAEENQLSTMKIILAHFTLFTGLNIDFTKITLSNTSRKSWYPSSKQF